MGSKTESVFILRCPKRYIQGVYRTLQDAMFAISATKFEVLDDVYLVQYEDKYDQFWISEKKITDL